jgi:hypothetical protein
LAIGTSISTTLRAAVSGIGSRWSTRSRTLTGRFQSRQSLKDGQIISKVTDNFLPQLVLEQNPGIQVIEDDSGYQRLISADMVAGYQAAMREINALYAQMQEQRAEPKAALEAELLNFVALQAKYQDDLRVWEDTRDALRSGPSDTA